MVDSNFQSVHKKLEREIRRKRVALVKDQIKKVRNGLFAPDIYGDPKSQSVHKKLEQEIAEEKQQVVVKDQITKNGTVRNSLFTPNISLNQIYSCLSTKNLKRFVPMRMSLD
jgi:hypothetical protein